MTKLTIKQLKDMFIGGGISIANEFEYINQLNIFPVPDGDTGSNMKITTEGASNSIKNTNFNDLATLGKTYSRALLMNARGNSGVIFSQIMKGFVSSFKPQSNEITLEELNNAFTAAKEQAYKTLSSPIEGTILTVIRMTADGLHQKTTSIKTVEDLFTEAVKIAYQYFKSNASSISGQISYKDKDYVMQVKDLHGVGMTNQLTLATFIALCSVALNRQVTSSTAILGNFSLGGTIEKVPNLADALQVCLDSGAKKVLIPMSSYADIALVPPELFSKFTTIPYNSPEDAVMKALGVE